MRFFSYRAGTVTGIGLVGQDGIARGLVAGAVDYPGSLHTLIGSGPEALKRAAATLQRAPTVDATKIAFLPPVLAPDAKIICVGLNYADHSKESNYDLPTYPTLFARFASSLVAHGEPLIKPLVSDQFDYEGELVAIIGKRGRHIDRARALDHVAGYSLFNDGSVRDLQHRTPQWTMGKNFDGTGAYGPYFVTADELPPGAAGLKIATRLNGTVVQSATTSDLVFDVRSLVAIVSEAMTLEPGDLIVTGTPAGVGVARKPPLFLKHGDTCEIEVEGVGVLVNRVENELQGARS